jgi:hypothetical protein
VVSKKVSIHYKKKEKEIVKITLTRLFAILSFDIEDVVMIVASELL